MRAFLLYPAMGAAVLLAARNDTVVGDGANRVLASYRDEEEGMLVAAGFKPEEGGALWARDGVCFGREAALQHTWQEWCEHKGQKTL